ncbi:hypothetical protein BDV25DRAFT_141436 [Aspergillus avenaceus]|uniref:F-box domain-containing protein n=1 Tax=Aspergillus avenaceus TaxID=36643 RepID=A0A5N6TR67_ASPAV|nr:hypothetical protein BDV25DRAFT_141436 [Aspergillus avenaceus]
MTPFTRVRSIKAKFTKRRPPPNLKIWTLPAPILLHIISHLDLPDFQALRLTTRALNTRIKTLEPAIAHTYYVVRRSELSFIAELFPPPPPLYGADDRPEYSLAYLADLTTCWRTCLRLSFYLAEHVVLRGTHHVMTLLCDAVRALMAPCITYSSETWLAALLTQSTLEKVVELFAAAARDGNGRDQRMEFLWSLREVVGCCGEVKLERVWFCAARREICRRGAIPHFSGLSSTLGTGDVRCEFCE